MMLFFFVEDTKKMREGKKYGNIKTNFPHRIRLFIIMSVLEHDMLISVKVMLLYLVIFIRLRWALESTNNLHLSFISKHEFICLFIIVHLFKYLSK